jgi:putative tryptophan/tyrosine transport system substrate-binding protein
LLAPEVTAKGLALLKEAVPFLNKVAVFWNAANQANALVWRDVEATARALGLALYSQPVRETKDFDAAFGAIIQERPDGLLVLSDALLYQYKSQIVDFTATRNFQLCFRFEHSPNSAA